MAFVPSRLLALGVFVAVAAAFMAPDPAAAAGCPANPIVEHGGRHWCFNAGTSGNVHLWTPSGYDGNTAFTAIFIHGLDTGQNGPDACNKKVPYVDCIWDAPDHDIVSQFASSGMNALFVAIEGQNKSAKTEPLRWKQLNALLTAISDKGKIVAPQKVTLLAHSGGMYTARSLWNDARVTHVVPLDWLSPSLDSDVKKWYQGNKERRLTIVSGNGNQLAIGEALSKELSCPAVAGTPSLSTDQVNARCLHVKTGVSHMKVVMGKKSIPLALLRSGGVASSGSNPASPSGASSPSGAGKPRPLADAVLGGPVLEIPIPNVEFTDAIRQDGRVTIPWLAQYISGIYTFLLSIAGMLASVMMVVGGFQYLTSGGDQGKVGAGKKKITDALIGLMLALGSYVILYSINPKLVAFDGLQLAGIQTEVVEDEVNGSNEGGLIDATDTDVPLAASGGKPTALCNSQDSCASYCAQYFSDPSKLPPSAPGMAPPSAVQKIPSDITGVNGFGNSTSPTTIALLRKVGPLFAADGYTLAVGSGYRDLKGQFKLACEAYRDGRGDRVGRTIANPGGSFHGIGFAIDVSLWKGGKQITIAGNSDAQQQENPEEAKYLAEKMLSVGFRRLNNEIWHFEPANAPATSCRCYKIDDCTLPPKVRCP